MKRKKKKKKTIPKKTLGLRHDASRAPADRRWPVANVGIGIRFCRS